MVTSSEIRVDDGGRRVGGRPEVCVVECGGEFWEDTEDGVRLFFGLRSQGECPG